MKIAREKQADLFLSGACRQRAQHGGTRIVSLYAGAEGDRRFFPRFGQHENEADLMGGMDLPPADKDVTAILYDLAARRTRNTAQHAKASFVQGVGATGAF